MTTNINKIVNLRLFDPKYRDRLISLAKGDEPIASQSLRDTYQEALLVLNEMGDEARADAKTLITRQQRTLSYIIESSRDCRGLEGPRTPASRAFSPILKTCSMRRTT